MLFALPIGVMSGIYINEYAKASWYKRFIQIMTNNLAGIPSIVFGLFGMALFVMVVITFLVNPGWGLPYIRASLSNLYQGVSLNAGTILATWFP